MIPESTVDTFFSLKVAIVAGIDWFHCRINYLGLLKTGVLTKGGVLIFRYMHVASTVTYWNEVEPCTCMYLT